MCNKMRNRREANHVLYLDGLYYYVRRVPYDLTSYYNVKRLCLSLRNKSASAAVRASQSINQRLEDYWLGLRLQNMNIPAIQVVRASDEANDATLRLSQACELYLRLKGLGDVIDAIGNWTTTGMGQRYGLGQPLKVKAKWMKQLIPF